MSGRLEYQAPMEVSPSQRADDLASGDERKIADAMLFCALNGEDYEFTSKALVLCSRSEDVSIRALAVICISHILRVFGRIPEGNAEDILVSAATSGLNPLTGNAQSVLEDLSEWRLDLHKTILRRIEQHNQDDPSAE